MTKITLTDNQRIILDSSARSANLAAWPLPKRLALSPGSAAIVIRGLLRKGLLEKRPAIGGDPIWKEEGGKRFTLVITKAGLAACGIQPAVDSPPKGAVAPKGAAVAAASLAEPRMPRAGSKLSILVELLARKGGATIAEMAAATGWQLHSVRGVVSGMLSKKLGLEIGSEKTAGKDRFYRLRE